MFEVTIHQDRVLLIATNRDTAFSLMALYLYQIKYLRPLGEFDALALHTEVS